MRPALARHPELVSGSSSPPSGQSTSWTLKQVQGDDGAVAAEWQEALARFRQADEEVEALVHCRNQRVYDRALGRHSTALGRLLRAPAPDLAAAGLKLELIVRHHVFEANFAEASLGLKGRVLECCIQALQEGSDVFDLDEEEQPSGPFALGDFD